MLSAALLLATAVLPVYAEEPPTQVEEEASEAVARISLCSTIYFFPVVGHEWIYVENLTDEPLTVGFYELMPGEGVSIGCFSFTVADGWGVYYNVEAFRENRDDNLGNCRSVTEDLTAEGLKKLSDALYNYHNFWGVYCNCMFFAFSIWNAATDNFLIPLIIPALGHLQVMICGGEKGVLEMYEPSTEEIFRQKGTGRNATLVPVSELTLKN